MQCIFYMLKQCVTSINALKSDIKSLAAYGHLIEEVKSLVRNFSDFFFFFFCLKDKTTQLFITLLGMLASFWCEWKMFLHIFSL